MAYTSGSFVANEQPSAAKFNLLWTNDASFNDGTGIQNGVLTRAQLLYGLVRQRQGGATGDSSWVTTGTSATDTSAKGVFIQAGSVASSNGGAVTVTFPTAFAQIPLVWLTVKHSGAGAIVQLDGEATTTNFAFAVWTPGGALINAEPVHWLAIGQ